MWGLGSWKFAWWRCGRPGGKGWRGSGVRVVQGLGFRLQASGSGFWFKDLEYRVQGSGFRVSSHRSKWISHKWRFKVFFFILPLIPALLKIWGRTSSRSGADPRDLPVSSRMCQILLHNRIFKGSLLQAKNSLKKKKIIILLLNLLEDKVSLVRTQLRASLLEEKRESTWPAHTADYKQSSLKNPDWIIHRAYGRHHRTGRGGPCGSVNEKSGRTYLYYNVYNYCIMYIYIYIYHTMYIYIISCTYVSYRVYSSVLQCTCRFGRPHTSPPPTQALSPNDHTYNLSHPDLPFAKRGPLKQTISVRNLVRSQKQIPQKFRNQNKFRPILRRQT